MKLLYFLILSIFIPNIQAQKITNFPFQVGEEIHYSVYYHLAWVWVDAANVSFFVSDTTYRNQSSFLFSSKGQSKENYDWIFKVRDQFTSIISKENLSPLFYHRNTIEGSFKANNYYLFNSNKEQIYSFINNSEKSKFKDTLLYNKEIFDVLSATYYLRTLNLELFKIGDTIPINTVMDNEIVKINILYLGKENVTHKNEKTYPCYKFKANAIEGSVFDSDSEIYVWVSQDENKIPIKVESNILVGSVIAYLKSVKKPKVKASNWVKDFNLD